uniref:Uncharacterized protein n=1 Tax=Rhizophora mucronata TaxID=61149 RepID=A0A2P2NXF2_RHIMU
MQNKAYFSFDCTKI